MDAEAADAPPATSCRARLFGHASGGRDLDCDDLPGLRLDDHMLLWVDLLQPDAALLDAIWSSLGLPDAARTLPDDGGTTPWVRKYDGFFAVRAIAVDNGCAPLNGHVFTLLAGRNVVVSIHRQALPFIDEMHGRNAGQADVGVLCAQSFVAAVLDGHLSTYFEAAADFEMAVERLEVDILADRRRDCLPELRRLRRHASRMRRMLSPHRAVFGVLSRPDFSPAEDRAAERHFDALDTRFERAMDIVENARELVIGSFDLFSSQTALKTNDAMRILTFATVVTGVLAVIAGALGMNFNAGLFQTRAAGFWAAVGGMGLLAGGAIAYGRWRRWF